jgi:TRAP-type C4-dicarboxylate transport system permease small subunit
MPLLARAAARLLDALAVATFTGMFLCVIAQVVLRYFFGDPLTWSDELARYLFVWCAFVGWIIAARKRSHLGIALVAERSPPRVKAAIELVGALAAVAFAGVLLYYGLQITARNADVDTVTLFFTFGVVYAIVPAAALAVGALALADARAALSALTRPAESPR